MDEGGGVLTPKDWCLFIIKIEGLYKKSSSGIIKRVGLKRGQVGLCLDSGIWY